MIERSEAAIDGPRIRLSFHRLAAKIHSVPEDTAKGHKLETPEGPAGGTPGTPPDTPVIREELSRILASPAFRNSKRYSTLLKYLVDHTLAGRTKELKERTIGIEVFERDPDYDTSIDHVVRSSGSELRKRLAQYYQESGTGSRIRFDLYPGSYVLHFRVLCAETEDPHYVGNNGRAGGVFGPTHQPGQWLFFLAFFAAGVAVVLGISALRSWRSETALDRFWKPVTSQPESVILCVGPDRRIFGDAPRPPSAAPSQPSQSGASAVATAAAATTAAPTDRARQVVVGDDAIALAQVAAELARRHKSFRIFLGSSATFEDIRERPSVLIGSRNNDAALEVLDTMRFRIVAPGAGVEPYIVDTEKKSGSVDTWVPTRGALRGEYVRDYALIVRCMSPQAGKIVVVAGGVHAPGNFAAGDFLTNEKLMAQLEARAPRGWQQKNIELVLATDVVKGVAGVPVIAAAHFW